jgi:hypothetical protein
VVQLRLEREEEGGERYRKEPMEETRDHQTGNER